MIIAIGQRPAKLVDRGLHHSSRTAHHLGGAANRPPPRDARIVVTKIGSDGADSGQPRGAVIVSPSPVSRLYQRGLSATVCKRPLDPAHELGDAGG
jgi:hypothetical protein